MAEQKPAVWDVALRPLERLRRGFRRVHKAVRADYWSPQVPLSLALAAGGAFVVWLAVRSEERVLLADFPEHILNLRPASMPYVLIGIGMIITAVGLLLRSRLSWIIALVLTASTILIAALLGQADFRLLVIYYDGGLLVTLLLAYRRFDRSSLAAGTLFAITGALLVVIYGVFGALYLGNQFSPPIRDIVTAFYYAVATMGTVGYYGVPLSQKAKLFTASVVILGLAVFASSVTAIIAPVLGRVMSRKEKRVKRSGHFIVVGATRLAYNTYRELKRRDHVVTLIVPRPPEAAGVVEEADLVVGDVNSLEALRKADAADAQAVLAMRADDSDNAFIVLAVKELKGSAKTVVAINDSSHMERIKLVQPDIVIAPEVFGGELLAMLLSGEAISSDFLTQRFLHFRPGEPSKPSSS